MFTKNSLLMNMCLELEFIIQEQNLKNSSKIVQLSIPVNFLIFIEFISVSFFSLKDR